MRKIKFITVILATLVIAVPVSYSSNKNISMDHKFFRENYDEPTFFKSYNSNPDWYSSKFAKDHYNYDQYWFLMIDSLQLSEGSNEFYIIKKVRLNNPAELLEVDISINNEMVLESWMMKVFKTEKMDPELELENWMTKPFMLNQSGQMN